jgi:hypothetical protein
VTFFTTRPPDLMVSPRPGDRRDTKKMIARSAGLDAARARKIGRNRAAERAAVYLRAQHGP